MAYSVMQMVPTPPIPHTCTIMEGLTPKKKIAVQGMFAPNIDHFVINLQCENRSGTDIALHFNPRFTQGQVVLNSFENGGWKNEEVKGIHPLKPGQHFEVVIYVEHSHYMIEINGAHFTKFDHRIPIHRVTTMHVGGQVQIYSIKCEVPSPEYTPGGFMHPAGAVPPPHAFGIGPQPPPPTGMMNYPPQPPQSFPQPAPPVFNPTVPFISGVPGGSNPGKMIQLSGVPLKNASRFTFNLMENAIDSSDIALHFDVRFKYGSDTNVIVRNHQRSCAWGTEERHIPYFPFSPGAPFDILVLVEGNCFKVAVNNQHFLEFAHRLHPPSRYSIFKVTGDLKITQARFQ